MDVFNKELDEYIIEKHTQHYQQKIPEQLYPAPEYGTGENNVPV